MKVTTKLLLSFLAVSILPLAAVGYAGTQAMGTIRSLVTGESTAALTQLGEDAIHQKAVDVARQVELYLEAHPELLTLPPETLEANEELATIAVQPVGETGYTAVYDSRGVTHFHVNPAIVSTDLEDLADTLPAFWAIIEASLEGSTSAGYYEWEDADGEIRDKYMSCVPVGETDLRVAATTYIDEFSQPVREMEDQIAAISQRVQRHLLIGLVVLGLLAVGLALWLAWSISHPLRRLTEAARALEQGTYRSSETTGERSRRDDVGQLARAFDHMAQEVRAREENLHRQIESLRIQIDEVRRAQQVAVITETEYFQELQEKIQRLRESRDAASEEQEDGAA